MGNGNWQWLLLLLRVLLLLLMLLLLFLLRMKHTLDDTRENRLLRSDALERTFEHL